jgi:integrase
LKVVQKFYEFCLVDQRLSARVSKDYRNVSRRFLKFCDGQVSKETVRGYLISYLDKSPRTYNNQLDGLRAFVKRFLRRPDLMEGFKKAHIPNNFENQVPTKAQLKKGFEALDNDKERALYLFYATTGLRRSEALNLTLEDVDFEKRCVKAKHDTRTKRAGVTFYNEECERYLKKYITSREDDARQFFKIGYNEFKRLWKKASKAAGSKITPQVLRRWHSTMLGELMVPDRFVDVFQGRAPKNVLAKHYTGKGLERLKRIHDKAGITVLS